VVAQIVDNDLIYLGAEAVDDVSEQIMGHWPRRCNAFQTPVYGKYLHDPDYDRKTALALALLDDDYLLIGLLIDDYS